LPLRLSQPSALSTGSPMNISEAFSAKRDAYAKRMGSWIISEVTTIGEPMEVWKFVRDCGSRTMRVLYRCKDGTVRDIVGRQGVHDSVQDGKVQGVGHAMASSERGTLSFWTHVHNGRAVNTGSGSGYRTLRADGILAIRCDGHDIITATGRRSL
jgi:hypothetical protein